MSCIKRNKMGIILKLDFEESYDKVNWVFLQQVLRMKGFSSKWCNWIEQIIVSGGCVCVCVCVTISVVWSLNPLICG
jgi:hypothetical protein